MQVSQIAMSQVFVFAEQVPFGRDLTDLLHPEAELDALGWETDLDEAIWRIQEIHPPAVIVAGQDADTDCGTAVSRIQAECPGVQIAEINLETRVVRIYGGEDQIVHELKDLLSVVKRLGSAGRNEKLAHCQSVRRKDGGPKDKAEQDEGESEF